MATTEQKQKILIAKVAVALSEAIGRVPEDQELRHVSLLICTLCQAVLELH